MPCKPEIEIQPAEAEKNIPKGTLYSCNSGTINYLITYSDFEIVLDSKSMLDAYAEGAVDGSTVISKRPLLLGRIPGRELVLTSCIEGGGPPMVYKWHIYHVGKRIYAVTSASQDPISDAANVSRFMTSFAILR
jgi:hypothetical protein